MSLLLFKTLEFSDSMKSNPILTQYPWISGGMKKSLEWTDSSHCFIFPAMNMGGPEMSGKSQHLSDEMCAEILLSLPFKNIYIEHLIPKDQQAVNDETLGTITFNRYGIWVHEKQPGEIEFVNISESPNNRGMPAIAHITAENKDRHALMLRVAANYVKILRDRKYEVGQGKAKHRIKMRDGRSIIKKLIYIRPKRENNSTYPISESIDWSHRWVVMGHWRKTHLLGKDRNGVYCVNGYTWVVPHEKGPEGKPLISDKVRLLRPEAIYSQLT